MLRSEYESLSTMGNLNQLPVVDPRSDYVLWWATRHEFMLRFVRYVMWKATEGKE